MTDNTPAEQEAGAARPADDHDIKDVRELTEGAALASFDQLHLGEHYIAAFNDMAYKGMSLSLAATKHSIRVDNLTRAFDRPQVRRVYNQILKGIRNGAGMQAYIRNLELSQTSNSDHVKADLNKWIAGVDGIAALKRVEGRIHHQHSFGGFDYDEDEPVDVTPEDSQSPADDAGSSIKQGQSGKGGTHDCE